MSIVSKRVLAVIAVALVAGTGTAAAAPSTAVRFVPQLAHQSGVSIVRFSADGRLMVTTGGDSAIKVWDLELDVILMTLYGHTGSIYGLWLDGSMLVSASADGSVRLWDLDTATLVRAFTGHDRLSWAQLTADRRTLESRSANGDAFAFDVATGAVQTTRTPRELCGALPVSGFDATGKHVVCSDEHDLEVWEVVRARRTSRMRLPFIIQAIEWLPGAKRVMVAGQDKVAVVEVSNGRARWTKSLDTNWVKSVSVSADGTLGATADNGNRVNVFDLRSGKIVRTFDEEEGNANPRRGCSVGGCLDRAFLSPNGKRVAAIGSGYPFRVWRVDTGGAPTEVRGRLVGGGTQVAFAPSDTRAVAAFRWLDVWDTTALARVRAFGVVPDRDPYGVVSIGYAPDNRRVVLATGTGSPTVWNVEAVGNPFERMLEGKPRLVHIVDDVRVSADGQRVFARQSSESHVWSLSDGKLLRKGKDRSDDAVQCSNLARDGKRIACDRYYRGGKYEAVLVDTTTGTELARAPTGDSKMLALAPDATWILSGQDGGYLERIALGSNAPGFRIQAHAVITALALASDGRFAITGGRDGLVRVWNTADGKLLRELPGHGWRVMSISIRADGLFAMTGAADGTSRIWNLRTGKSVVLVSSPMDWVIYDDDGHFDASRGGASLVAAVQGDRAYQIDQLAVRANRPDLLLDTVGLGTPALRDHFRARYERRVQKLGLRTQAIERGAGAAPTSAIVNVELAGRKATISADVAAATGSELASYNIYVNNVPVLGAAGKPIGGARQPVVDTVELATGSNKLEVVALDTAGVESLRPFRVVSVAGDVKPRLFYLGFGVSRHRDPTYTLAYAHKDALDLAAVFESMRDRFAEVRVATYIDAQVTIDAIRKARSHFADAGVDDIVVLFVAGHGVHGPGREAPYYYITHDSNPADLAGTAAPFELIENLLHDIAPRRKLFLMDTCESGESDGVTPPPTMVAGTRLVPRTARGFRVGPKTAAPREVLAQTERFIYNDLARRSGAIVLSSSGGAELSFETPELQNGIFTEQVMAALVGDAADADKSGSVSIAELRAFVERTVAEASANHQHPTVDRDNLAAVIELPRVPQAAAILTRREPEAALPPIPVLASAPPKLPMTTRGSRGCGCHTSDAASGVLALLVLGWLQRRRTPRGGSSRPRSAHSP